TCPENRLIFVRGDAVRAARPQCSAMLYEGVRYEVVAAAPAFSSSRVALGGSSAFDAIGGSPASDKSNLQIHQVVSGRPGPEKSADPVKEDPGIVVLKKSIGIDPQLICTPKGLPIHNRSRRIGRPVHPIGSHAGYRHRHRGDLSPRLIPSIRFIRLIRFFGTRIPPWLIRLIRQVRHIRPQVADEAKCQLLVAPALA